MSDAAAVQQGINASGSAVGDSDDEWEDLEDIGVPRKGMRSTSEDHNLGLLTYSRVLQILWLSEKRVLAAKAESAMMRPM